MSLGDRGPTPATGPAMSLTGKSCLIAGGSRGIGLELARQLLKKGNTVVATARVPSKATELQKLSAESGSNLTITQLDVASPESVEAWARGLKSTHSHFDLVICNAGIIRRTSLSNVTSQDMVDCFITNTIGPLLVVQQLHKQRLIGPPGTLLANMTSKMGSVDDNGSGGSYAYRASKAALNIVNKSLSIDLQSDGVTCVLLHPGYVRTDMTGGAGLIDVNECASGLLAVLESGRPLNGRWYDYAGKEIPW